MPRKPKPASDSGRSPIYRYWVELRDLHTGTTRNLPLRLMHRVCLKAGKGEPLPPDEQFLQLIDDSAVVEARDLEDLKTQLRQKYPDEAYERRLFYERDLDAEERTNRALDNLARIFSDGVVDDLLKEAAG
jgi:hypothetical protein